ncbi:MAG: RidA family protein [Myxococcaceae bacterium]|nr:RidA family protein [Myxococcaceae bacterium]
MSTPEQRLRDLGIELPVPPRPLGSYVPARISGNLVYLSGMVPVEGGVPRFVGRLGANLQLEEGRQAARIAALNALSTARAQLGSLDRLQGVVRLAAYFRTTEEFTEHPKVADAASELFRDIFGPDNGHTRLVLGVSSLPAGMCVVLDVILALREG